MGRLDTRNALISGTARGTGGRAAAFEPAAQRAACGRDPDEKASAR